MFRDGSPRLLAMFEYRAHGTTFLVLISFFKGVYMYLFFDTETTGTSRHKDHVVQVAWVLANEEGNIQEEECHVIRPDGYSIPTAAANIHGITTANVQKWLWCHSRQ